MTAETEHRVTPTWSELVAICEENSARRQKVGHPDMAHISHRSGIRSVAIEDTEIYVLAERLQALQDWVSDHMAGDCRWDGKALERKFGELIGHVASFDPEPAWCSEIMPPDEPARTPVPPPDTVTS